MRRRAAFLTALLPFFASPAAAAPDRTGDAADRPPVLLSTEEAAPWSSVEELAKAAEGGDPNAAFDYAQLLHAGEQVEKDERRAFALYRQAAEAGVGNAIFRLAKLHHDGELGLSVDYGRAFELYRRAAEAGVSEAMYNLGAMLVSARGVKRNYVEGLAWLMVAGRHGADAASGIDQVKQRLARWPDRIAAAERRADELEQAISDPDQREEDAPPPAAKAKPPRPSPPARPSPSRPPPPQVTIDRPSITVPPPLPPPKPGS